MKLQSITIFFELIQLFHGLNDANAVEFKKTFTFPQKRVDSSNVKVFKSNPAQNYSDFVFTSLT